ncbi:hypothetical protein PENSPDRAFT_671375 [Peniophora sp. CONT]|nr:hypothetical protein PENSPDRAFT_671375 [Peniophora sp. CONT]
MSEPQASKKTSGDCALKEVGMCRSRNHKAHSLCDYGRCAPDCIYDAQEADREGRERPPCKAPKHTPPASASSEGPSSTGDGATSRALAQPLSGNWATPQETWAAKLQDLSERREQVERQNLETERGNRDARSTVVFTIWDTPGEAPRNLSLVLPLFPIYQLDRLPALHHSLQAAFLGCSLADLSSTSTSSAGTLCDVWDTTIMDWVTCLTDQSRRVHGDSKRLLVRACPNGRSMRNVDCLRLAESLQAIHVPPERIPHELRPSPEPSSKRIILESGSNPRQGKRPCLASSTQPAASRSSTPTLHNSSLHQPHPAGSAMRPVSGLVTLDAPLRPPSSPPASLSLRHQRMSSPGPHHSSPFGDTLRVHPYTAAAMLGRRNAAVAGLDRGGFLGGTSEGTSSGTSEGTSSDAVPDPTWDQMFAKYLDPTLPDEPSVSATPMELMSLPDGALGRNFASDGLTPEEDGDELDEDSDGGGDLVIPGMVAPLANTPGKPTFPESFFFLAVCDVIRRASEIQDLSSHPKMSLKEARAKAMAEKGYLNVVKMPSQSTFSNVQRCLKQGTLAQFETASKGAKRWSEYTNLLKTSGLNPGVSGDVLLPGTGKYPWEIACSDSITRRQTSQPASRKLRSASAMSSASSTSDSSALTASPSPGPSTPSPVPPSNIQALPSKVSLPHPLPEASAAAEGYTAFSLPSFHSQADFVAELPSISETDTNDHDLSNLATLSFGVGGETGVDMGAFDAGAFANMDDWFSNNLLSSTTHPDISASAPRFM